MLGTETAIATHSGKTELIIALTLLRIVQNIIGLGRLLEFLLGRLVPRIAIRGDTSSPACDRRT